MRSRQTFLDAERDRNKALAFIGANPGCVLADVMRHMDMTRSRAAQLLFRLWELGEVRREAGGVGVMGRGCSKYYALAERTITTAEVFAKLHQNITGEVKPVVKPVARHAPIVRIFGGL